MPIDAFNGLQQVYGKFVCAEDLRREYMQFASANLELGKTLTLPKTLHINDANFTNFMYEADTEEEITDDDLEKIHNSEGTMHMMYKVCNETGLKYTFPTLYIALSIALTLPISIPLQKELFPS